MTELAAPSATRLKVPSWLDGRLVVGVLLVLVSVVIGAKIIASADRYDAVWATSRALAPGTTLARSDLVRVDVRFKDHGGIYLAADGPSPTGRVTSQPLAAGQLIPLAAVPPAPVGAMRLVTVPVDKLHMPRDNDLHGVQVDLYVTPKSNADNTAPTPRLVLSAVTIAATITDSALGGSGGSGVVLAVPIAFVDAVVSAAQEGSVDLVRVPDGATATQPSPPPASSPAAPIASPSEPIASSAPPSAPVASPTAGT